MPASNLHVYQQEKHLINDDSEDLILRKKMRRDGDEIEKYPVIELGTDIQVTAFTFRSAADVDALIQHLTELRDLTFGQP